MGGRQPLKSRLITLPINYEESPMSVSALIDAASDWVPNQLLATAFMLSASSQKLVDTCRAQIPSAKAVATTMALGASVYVGYQVWKHTRLPTLAETFARAEVGDHEEHIRWTRHDDERDDGLPGVFEIMEQNRDANDQERIMLPRIPSNRVAWGVAKRLSDECFAELGPLNPDEANKRVVELWVARNAKRFGVRVSDTRLVVSKAVRHYFIPTIEEICDMAVDTAPLTRELLDAADHVNDLTWMDKVKSFIIHRHRGLRFKRS